MPAVNNAPPATVAKALDAVAEPVLAMVAATPRPTMQALSVSVQRRFGIAVEPDNLRMWIARRHAEAVRSRLEPAVSCPLDDHLELVNELRDPARNGGRVYIWRQVLEVLKSLDPRLEDYSEEGLRSWYSRRARRGDKAQAVAARAVAGRNSLAARNASPSLLVHSDAPAPATFDSTTEPAPAAPAARVVETPVAPVVVAPGQDAQRAAAADELERLRGQNADPLADLLGKYMTPQAPQ